MTGRAQDPPLRDRFIQGLGTFETRKTADSNLVLDARASEHHPDLTAAAAIAYYLSSNAPQLIAVGQLAGYWG